MDKKFSIYGLIFIILFFVFFLSRPVLADVDKAKFQDLIEKANSGDAESQFLLGFMYQSGIGVKQDSHKAAELYTKASNQGLAKAQCLLGYMYKVGEGVK